jgi:uncharacterized damage-inducible protein DinB
MPETTAPPPSQFPEPWLRSTKQDVPAVPRAVLHALELAHEDLHRWCAPFSDADLNASPSGLPSVAFQIRHIARSVDRLLTYAEARSLNAHQQAQLQSESATAANKELFSELDGALTAAATRILALASTDLEQPRSVGTRALPTTLGGLLVHIADHTQRHVGQAITTAKLLHPARP